MADNRDSARSDDSSFGGAGRPKRRKNFAKTMIVQDTLQKAPNHQTWFRGEHTNFNPTRAQLIPVEALHDHVLRGWAPAEPWITPQTRITAFGSCFASNISEWLARRNYSVLNKAEDAGDAYVVRMGEGMVNSFVIRQQFEWAWENKVFEQPLWHGYKAEAFGYDEKVRRETKRIFDGTDLFILTFGLSEVWYDSETENVFWRTIPKDVYDPARHRFRVSTVEENRANIRAIYDLIRKHRPDAKMIFTLSPVPLSATFRDIGCISANSVSKSVLRVALDEVMREVGPEGFLHYWPSFEIIADILHLPYAADRRHPEQATIDFIMMLFEHVWCRGPDHEKPSLRAGWVMALVAAGQLPPEIGDMVAGRKIRRLSVFLRDGPTDPDLDIRAAKHALLTALRDDMRAERDTVPLAAE